MKSMNPIDHPISGPSYEIRVRGQLETYWSAYFDGWSICNLENGEVLFSNSNVDQARLHGVLNRIRDLNLTLLSVCQVNRKDGADNSTLTVDKRVDQMLEMPKKEIE
jgi:hypothetical protein